MSQLKLFFDHLMKQQILKDATGKIGLLLKYLLCESCSEITLHYITYHKHLPKIIIIISYCK